MSLFMKGAEGGMVVFFGSPKAQRSGGGFDTPRSVSACVRGGLHYISFTLFPPPPSTPIHNGEVNDMTCAFDMCFTCHFFDMRTMSLLHVPTCHFTCTVTYTDRKKVSFCCHTCKMTCGTCHLFSHVILHVKTHVMSLTSPSCM